MAENTHETKIVVTGDASSATGTLNGIKNLLSKGVVGALNGVRSAVNKVMGALGLFGIAMQGVQFLVEGYKKLTDWMHRAAKAAAEIRLAAVLNDAANAMDRLVSRQEAYNKLLKEELADLGRRKELKSIEDSGKEQRETEKREIARAKEIAGAENEDEERAIRQRWAEEDELRERGNRYRKLKGNVAEETEKSAIYGSKAGAAEANVKTADAAIAEIRANFARMNEEQLKEAKKQIEALEAKRKANAEAAAQFRTEEKMAEKRAELYRQQIEDVRKGGGVAQAKNDAENAKIARSKAEKEKTEKDKRDQNLEDKQLERRREEELARLDPRSATYEKDKKEIERRYEIEAAEAKVGRATNDEDRAAAEEELQAIKIRQGREQAEDRQGKFSEYEDRLADQIDSGRPKDRLTAMGLGSGAAVDRTAQEQANNVKTLVQLVKEQIALTRENNQANVAVYAP